MQIELINDDHSCPNCYYEMFDDTAFPCSRCICNMPTHNMFQPKRADQTENCSEKPNNCKDEPQTEMHRCYKCRWWNYSYGCENPKGICKFEERYQTERSE